MGKLESGVLIQAEGVNLSPTDQRGLFGSGKRKPVALDATTGLERRVSRISYEEEAGRLLLSIRHAELLLANDTLPDKERVSMQSIYCDEMNRLILMHEGLVQSITCRLPRHLSRVMEREELVQEGFLGLLQAIRRYDGRGKFSTYAGRRVWGAMMDAIRTEDECRGLKTGRRTRRKIAKLRNLTPELDGPARVEIADELALAMNISRKKVIQLIAASETVIFPLDSQQATGRGRGNGDTLPLFDRIADPDPEPEEILMKKTNIGLLNEAMKQLKERERRILFMYYSEEKSQEEIGKILNVSESRISQLHAQAIKELRESLEAAKEEGLY